MKITTIIGARPQFIKAAAVSRAFRAEEMDEIIVHTGQHFDSNMSDVFFEELEIPIPKYNLGINSMGHGAMTGRMLESIEEVLLKEKPDGLLVYGDTNSTIAGALAAAKLHIPVLHVEAGLRSFNRKMPEEINRILTDHAADVCYAPNDSSVQQLFSEGIDSSKAVNVGDVMYDAALFFGEKAQQESEIGKSLGIEGQEYILSTIHRAENTDCPEKLSGIFSALDRVAAHCPVVLPLHPRTKAKLSQIGFEPENVKLISPIGYLDMVWLEKNAVSIVTDSGGIQKEAYFHRTPCVTLRDETEYTELVDAGWNTIAPPGLTEDLADVIRASVGRAGSKDVDYGDGRAAFKIASDIKMRYANDSEARRETNG